MSRLKLIISGIALTCFAFSPSWGRSDPLTVVASIFPLFDFTREVAGTAADVRLLLPPGVDPHSWEPKPSDIIELSRSDVFLYTSGTMEPWAVNIARAVEGRDIRIVRVMDYMEISGKKKDQDPHFWLDLSLSARTVLKLGDLFAEMDAANLDHYRTNARAYALRLNQLDKAYSTGLENCGSRKIITGGHAAYGYLTRRYGLEQIALYGLSPDAEPSPRHLAGIVGIVREDNVRSVFSEELMNPEMAQVLSRETGTKVMVLNPGVNLTASQWRGGLTFLAIMNRNLDVLREGLYCE